MLGWTVDDKVGAENPSQIEFRGEYISQAVDLPVQVFAEKYRSHRADVLPGICGIPTDALPRYSQQSGPTPAGNENCSIRIARDVLLKDGALPTSALAGAGAI